MANEVLTEQRERVLLITLNRPEARNAVNSALGQALVAAIGELDSDPGLTAGVLTGAGGGFSAGMDLKAFATEGPPKGFNQFLRNGSQKPLIAAVEGFALAGGLEIALTCDLIVAAKGVKLGIPEVNKGLFAAGGGLFRLPERVPYGVAMEMALTSDPITAERGHELGLVARLAEPGKAAEVALELAERIARNAPLAVAASKQIVRQTRGLSEDDAWALQGPLVAKVFTSEDAREGPRAFAEKRAPKWTGR
jgi:enoyl-CoA hydratase